MWLELEVGVAVVARQEQGAENTSLRDMVKSSIQLQRVCHESLQAQVVPGVVLRMMVLNAELKSKSSILKS